MEGDTQDKVCVGEARNFTLSKPHFPQICMCSSTQKLSRLWGFLWRSHHTSTID